MAAAKLPDAPHAPALFCRQAAWEPPWDSKARVHSRSLSTREPVQP